MKKIYFVLTFTGTWLSRVVRVYTRKQYAHVSLALDKDLKYMYSFGRLNPYNPISAGFVHEVQNEGVFKRFKNTDSFICSIEVTDKQYKKIKENIKKFESEKDLYGFNLLGLIGIVFGFRVKLNNKFYCAEFVKHILDISGVDLELPDMIKPEDFREIKISETVYKGKLREYNI